MLRKFITISILLAAMCALTAVAAEKEKAVPGDSAGPGESSADGGEYFIAYYFHGEKRCVTCKKLEAYSGEALSSGFAKELEDSLLIWKTVDYDEKENRHFIEDYGLYTKALILSKMKNGKEVEWKNLDRIWTLVGDKDKYIEYVQSETRKFMMDEKGDE